jgi:hypothetical protein
VNKETMPKNVVGRSLTAMEDRIAQLEAELAAGSSSSDNEEPPFSSKCAPQKRPKKQHGKEPHLPQPEQKVQVAPWSSLSIAERALRKAEDVLQQPTSGFPVKKKKRKRKPPPRASDGVDGVSDEEDGEEETTVDAASLRCEVCGVSVTSMELMKEHLQGRKHAQAVKVADARAEARYCEVCSIVFTGPDQLAEHLKGRKHRDRAARGMGSS